MAAILFVCMGNICRSPIAEALLRALAQRHAPQLVLDVDSAGTHGYHTGAPPDERAQAVAARHGIDMSGLRARRLVVADFGRFDRVLVMDRLNLLAATDLAPPERRARLGLLLDAIPAQPVREVPDPYYGDETQFEAVFELLEQAIRALLQQLQQAEPSAVYTATRSGAGTQ